MALDQTSQRTTREDLTITGIGGLLAYFAVVLILARNFSSSGDNPNATVDAAILVAALVLLVFMTGFYGRLSNRSLQGASNVTSDKFDRVQKDEEIDCRGTTVIYVMLFVVGGYIAAYALVVAQIKEELNVIHFVAVAINALAIASMLYVTINYAVYVRMLAIIDLVCRKFEKYKVPDSGDPAVLDLDDIRKMRTAIFRWEALFEPPGGTFVVIGITGTFMGLALGLTTLPLREIVDVSHAINPATGKVYTAIDAGHRALELAMPFVRSMGLALGVSTAGVIGSVAAQWLRGYSGPPATTEHVLHAADELIRHKGNRSQTIERLIAELTVRVHEMQTQTGKPSASD